MQKIAVITGAGSGVGQAMALRLVKEGWKIAIIGRRETALQETVGLIENKEAVLVCPCDVSQRAAVQATAQNVLNVFGEVEVLVNAAGTNVPRRSLQTLSPEDYLKVVEINMNGAYWCCEAFLPIMRKQQSGTIVNIGSVAGLKGGVVSGTAYSMSKFGMRGMNDAINAEERANNIRSCCIFPAEINTPIMDLRPNPPSAEARQQMLQPADIVDCAMLVINLPQRAFIEEIVIRPK